MTSPRRGERNGTVRAVGQTSMNATQRKAPHAARRAFVSYFIATTILTTAQLAAAQDSLVAARDLYSTAAYTEALAMLDGLHPSDRRPDDSRIIEQYRAFCLLALGRTAEAQHAVEAAVAAAPSYHLSNTDASPRVLSMFRDVRRQVLPAIVQQKYTEARAAFDRKDFGSAQAGFTQVL